MEDRFLNLRLDLNNVQKTKCITEKLLKAGMHFYAENSRFHPVFNALTQMNYKQMKKQREKDGGNDWEMSEEETDLKAPF